VEKEPVEKLRHILTVVTVPFCRRHFLRNILSCDILSGHLWVCYCGPRLQINSVCVPRCEKGRTALDD